MVNQDLSGLPVKCPNCKKILFKTTDKYDPNVSPRGDMLKSLVTYHLDFLLTSSTPVSSLTCPECTCQLAPYGRLTVIIPQPSPESVAEPENQRTIEPPGTEPESEVQGKDNPPDIPVTSPAALSNTEKSEIAKPFTCEVCGKSFGTKLALSGHKRSHK